jgi:hypothetical protein
MRRRYVYEQDAGDAVVNGYDDAAAWLQRLINAFVRAEQRLRAVQLSTAAESVSRSVGGLEEGERWPKCAVDARLVWRF